jgi:sulfite exporter TauE/SafE
MLAFGLGTLPSMLGLTLAAPALSQFLSDRLVRRIVGFSLLVLAAWMAVTLVQGHPGTKSTAGHQQHATTFRYTAPVSTALINLT